MVRQSWSITTPLPPSHKLPDSETFIENKSRQENSIGHKQNKQVIRILRRQFGFLIW
jgi:hypothetical protein